MHITWLNRKTIFFFSRFKMEHFLFETLLTSVIIVFFRMSTEISSHLIVLRNIKKPVRMTTGVARPKDATKTRAKPTQHFCNRLITKQ